MKKAVKLSAVICMISGIMMVQGCKKDPTIPILTTVTVSEVTVTGGMSGGNITSDGGAEVTARGISWGIGHDPVITGSHTTDGKGTGAFVSSLTDLTPNTLYYIRAYATNSAGTAYGNEVSFTTGQITAAAVTTVAPSSIAPTTAVSGGNVTSDGGGAITERGVCWNTSELPTITNSKVATGAVTGSFVSNLTNLAPGTTYYIRAYAINGAGVVYGAQFIFNTKVADIAGNNYNTVKIGTKTWMAENLKTTKFNDDTAIPIITDNTIWTTVNTPGYCWYLNDEAFNKPLYGALYNWYAVNTNKLCPTGWHVPTDTEYNTLELFLGMTADQVDLWGWRGTDQGSKLKNTTGWSSGENGTNTSGFAALPGGYRNHQTGVFSGRDILSYWWSSTDDSANGKPNVAWYRRLDGNNTGVYKASTGRNAGKYIRCVKD